MALTLNQTTVGPLYMSGAAAGTSVAFGVLAATTTVFTMDRNAATSPAITVNSIFKYYASAVNFSSPAELKICLQVSTDNNSWIVASEVSRYVGKDTLNIKDIVGSCQFPSSAYVAPQGVNTYRYFSIGMRLVGVPSYDSNGTLISDVNLAAQNTVTIVCGLSQDVYSATSATQTTPHVVIPNRPIY
jgi:hypothetical protein